MRSNLQSPAGFHLAVLGQHGFKYLTGTDSATGEFVAIQALVDTAVTVTVTKGDALTGITIPAGMAIYGPFTSITLTSGTALAYIA